MFSPLVLNEKENLQLSHELSFMLEQTLRGKVSKYGVFSGPYFPVFELNTERYSVSLHIQSKCWKIRTRKNFVYELFSRNEEVPLTKESVSLFFFFLSFF